MEVDDIGEFWIDDTKHIDLSRRRGKIREEKLIYINDYIMKYAGGTYLEYHDRHHFHMKRILILLHSLE